MDPTCDACGAAGERRWQIECAGCGTVAGYCAECMPEGTAHALAEAHARRCGARVTLIGPEHRETISPAAASAR